MVPWRSHYAVYHERRQETAADYPEVRHALIGDIATAVREDKSDGGLLMTVAVPVQRYKQVLGAVLLPKGSDELGQAAARYARRRPDDRELAVRGRDELDERDPLVQPEGGHGAPRANGPPLALL